MKRRINLNIDSVIFAMSAAASTYFTYDWARNVNLHLVKQAASQFVQQLALAL